MDALDALLTRRSSPRLTTPAPNDEQLNLLISAALRAADHALVRPWRFLSISGEGLDKLGALFVQAEHAAGRSLSEEDRQKLSAKPHRAPLIIVAIACLKEHDKVPLIEQEYSAAAGVQCLSLAAYAMGLGAMWRTGSKAYDETVRSGLGLTSAEKIIGFLYLGTPCGPLKGLVQRDPKEFLTHWK